MDNMQPGQMISPGNQSEPPVPAPGAPEPERPEEPATTPAPAPSPAPEPVSEASSAPAPTAEPSSETTDQGGWQYHPEEDTAAPALPDQVDWTASEFIAHEKSAGWYVLLGIGGLAAAAIDYLLTKDRFSTGIILFAALAFGIFAARKPHTQQYRVDHQGVWVGEKPYLFQNFKSFSVAEEGAVASVVFMPLKRLMPPLTIYVAPEVEEQVVAFLSTYLPFAQHRADAVDSLLRRIRF